MGSFNTSCFVSQQTIAPGDESVILPILQQATYNPVELVVNTHEGIKEVAKYGYCHSTCYPTAFWGYYGPMIFGSYDDYGRFELEDTDLNAENLTLFFNTLSKDVCDVKQGENQYHDHGMVFSKIYNPEKEYTFKQLVKVWEKVWEMADEARLFAKNYKGEPCSVAFAVMHKSASDYLIESVEKAKTWSGESLERKTYFHNYINKEFGRIFKLFEKKKEKQDIVTFGAVGMISLQGFGIGENEGTYLSNHYNYPEYAIDDMIAYFNKNPEANSISKEVTNQIYEAFESQINHRYLAAGLNNFNLKLSPMVYASQDYHNEIGNAYLEMVKAVNQKVNEMVKEKYGEEEDEDEE